jgi:hypothetical protein
VTRPFRRERDEKNIVNAPSKEIVAAQKGQMGGSGSHRDFANQLMPAAARTATYRVPGGGCTVTALVFLDSLGSRLDGDPSLDLATHVATLKHRHALWKTS